jgi:LuxR family maltose regulon positive regulatory protein
MLTFPSPPAHVSAGATAQRDPVLITKLHLPPVPPDLVRRQHLIERLEPAQGQRLTLLCAPTGFGKTTALRDWAERTTRPVAWLSLDPGDNDPARFWDYVVAAIQAWHPDSGMHARALLRTPQPQTLEYVVAALINDLVAQPAPLSLVLDDYHLVTDEAVHQSMRYLLDHLPPHVHVLIASRIDPPLGLPRLRAQGMLAELRGGDLRFRMDEASAFLVDTIGLPLTSDDVRRLERRTEGWIAGLRLAALALKQQPDPRAFIAGFSGGHRSIGDYLADEVLDQLPEPVLSFLLETAILDRLCGALCDAVTGFAGGQGMLEQLEHCNAFLIPLDEERRWYRYQGLFADVLRDRLWKTHPERVPELHRRAAGWLFEQGMTREAVRHALEGDDLELVATFIEQRACPMFALGELDTIRDWIDALPDAMVRARPILCCLQAWVCVLSSRAADAEPYLADAERGAAAAGLPYLLGEVAAIRAYVARLQFDLPLAIELSQRARELVDEHDLGLQRAIALNHGIALWWSHEADQADLAFQEAGTLADAAGETVPAIVALCHRARLRFAQGQLRRALELYQQAHDLAREGGVGTSPAQSFVHLGLADLLIERDALDEALPHVEDCLRLGLSGGKVDHVIMAWISMTRLRLARGDLDGAREAARQSQLALDRHSVPHIAPVVAWAHVAVWLASGDDEAVERWAADLTERAGGDPAFDSGQGLDALNETERMTLARAWLAIGRPDDALVALSRVLERAEATLARGWQACWIETLALLACIQQAQGSPRQAVDTLARALALAEPEGMVRTIADFGAPMAALLARVPSARVSREYVDTLLAACRAMPSGRPAPSQPGCGVPRSVLSERELEVLHRIEDGLSNREIADALFVTVGTVKRHTNSIYTKLDVGSRTQALARARALNLLGA